MRLRSSVTLSAALVAVASVLAYVGPGRGLEGTSEAIGDTTRPYVLATPFYHPKSGTNATLHLTNMDDVSVSLNMRRYNAVGGLLSSTLVTVQQKATIIAFAGANSGAQMHVEIWSPSPFFTLELFFTDTASAQQRIPYSEMLKPRTGTGFVALDPFRLCDTRRSDTSCPAGILGAGEEVVVGVAGHGGVPAVGVSAVTVNLLSVGATQAGLLKIWPDGTPRPTATALFYKAGQTIANMMTVKVGTNGKVRVSSGIGQTHVVVELAGYYV
ncbi:MAG TPA: hypothetical protein VNA20_01590 [Frankiaceae bacterium]|nr:hypothetical protein [Frankiaceae bacterium]